MSEIDDGGPAYPMDYTSGNYPEAGMTLRDYFAGQALAGWLASFGEDQAPTAPYADMVEMIYGISDAMLAERKKARP